MEVPFCPGLESGDTLSFRQLHVAPSVLEPLARMAILIVENSPQDREHLTSLLSAEGYTEVVTAGSARHAFQYLGLEDPAQATRDVDLILLDMGIPDKGGVDACALISERDRLRDVPIIMLVGAAETGELDAAFKAGAVDYVSKPPRRVRLAGLASWPGRSRSQMISTGRERLRSGSFSMGTGETAAGYPTVAVGSRSARAPLRESAQAAQQSKE